MKNYLISSALVLGLSLASCSKKDDVTTPEPQLPTKQKEIVQCSIKVNGFTTEVTPMSKVLKNLPKDKDAEILFFDAEGKFAKVVQYEDNFAGKLNFEITEGSYTYVLNVFDDYWGYCFDQACSTIDDATVFIHSITGDKKMWTKKGELTVTSDGASIENIKVESPLGQLVLDITNESFSDKWKSVETKVVASDCTEEDKTTPHYYPASNTYKLGAGSITNTVAAGGTDDLDFSTYLLPYTNKYKMIITVESADASVTFAPIVVDNIEVQKGYTTTVQGALKEGAGIGEGEVTIVLEDIVMQPKETIEF